MFQQAHELGMFTVLWCYLRNPAFKTKDVDYHLAADLTGQANHLGVTIEADIIKQKLPETNGGYNAINFGKTHKASTRSCRATTRSTSRAISCQLLHGRSPSDQLRRRVGGESDLKEAVKTAVINKRAGGMGSSRAQGVSAAAEGRRRVAQRDPGRLSLEGSHDRIAGGLTAA
jgi:class I fructose-bisphosphate aldolase